MHCSLTLGSISHVARACVAWAVGCPNRNKITLITLIDVDLFKSDVESGRHAAGVSEAGRAILRECEWVSLSTESSSVGSAAQLDERRDIHHQGQPNRVKGSNGVGW